jgi:hypothetical protein
MGKELKNRDLLGISSGEDDDTREKITRPRQRSKRTDCTIDIRF